ncbi:glycine cleavage system protein GcvH [Paenibacillus sp. TRM 82003]|uniref:glycine cleavage system protein GcvH n=1 Tax=Kineococcus sp. TRM81007 TaxID=2925831 RepID=UPI001F5798CF|nr:glycine cleavage system protein GcvH [Kineococcus sp. TRM81007]MCI2240667.1 glycine cleavage system protein GcvH [Kineococcus sp. TRM81007]MCI3925411.1 glycine cleavage system protein GcvH [Paenibacillus sp. TRM 82003]
MASSVPEDLRYTAEHEWVRAEDGGTVRVGITDHAQDALGDVVYVSLPAEGETVTAGAACGEVESTKSVSEITAPVSGVVAAQNPGLETRPDLVNSDPYGEGWMFTVTVSDPAQLDGLLDAEGYRSHVG